MKKKFFLVTTVPLSLNFFNDQYNSLSEVFEVKAISSQKEILAEYGKEHNIDTYYISMKRNISLLSDIKALITFIRFFYKEQPDIVHGNTPKASLLSMLAAWITRVPVRIYMCHGLRYQGCTGLKRKLLMATEWISCHCATHVLSVSKGISNIMIEDGITSNKPIVIWNGSVCGINIEKFRLINSNEQDNLRRKLGLVKEHFVLTFVGRIVKDKGINELVEAFRKLSMSYPNLRLLLVGPKEDEGNSISKQTQIEIENNPAIIATGLQNNIPAFLSITNLFVFPSYREGFGLSLMEAEAMGIPSISSDIIGCNEVIENGITGILIPPHSSNAIVESVEKLYNDKELYLKMKSKCRISMIEKYECKKLLKMYIDFYCGLV